ncbi:hypothetical protein QBC43DRAFT_352176, partial [Cladorrhinum sp. PSN259]
FFCFVEWSGYFWSFGSGIPSHWSREHPKFFVFYDNIYRIFHFLNRTSAGAELPPSPNDLQDILPPRGRQESRRVAQEWCLTERGRPKNPSWTPNNSNALGVALADGAAIDETFSAYRVTFKDFLLIYFSLELLSAGPVNWCLRAIVMDLFHAVSAAFLPVLYTRYITSIGIVGRETGATGGIVAKRGTDLVSNRSATLFTWLAPNHSWPPV